jgi:hypothetical protein
MTICRQYPELSPQNADKASWKSNLSRVKASARECHVVSAPAVGGLPTILPCDSFCLVRDFDAVAFQYATFLQFCQNSVFAPFALYSIYELSTEAVLQYAS